MLGIGPDDDMEAARGAYRRLIRRVHPDLAPSPSAIDASVVTAAFAVIRGAHERGELPRPIVPVDAAAAAPAAVAVLDGEATATLEIAGPDPFLHLLEIGSQLGEITYQDREGGLFMVLLDDPTDPRCQLTGEVRLDGTEVEVAFALEPLGAGTAPPIDEVVARFGSLSLNHR